MAVFLLYMLWISDTWTVSRLIIGFSVSAEDIAGKQKCTLQLYAANEDSALLSNKCCWSSISFPSYTHTQSHHHHLWHHLLARPRTLVLTINISIYIFAFLQSGTFVLLLRFVSNITASSYINFTWKILWHFYYCFHTSLWICQTIFNYIILHCAHFW